MNKPATEQRQPQTDLTASPERSNDLARHPHHLWCDTHSESGEDVVVHLGRLRSIPISSTGDEVQVQVERTTHPTGHHRAHEPAPLIFLSDHGYTDGVRLTLQEAQTLREELGDAIREADALEIPADDPRDGVPDRCPQWCLGRNEVEDRDGWHFDGRHTGQSLGPRDWFVRRTRLYMGGQRTPRAWWDGTAAHFDSLLELAYGDDTPVELDAPTARSLPSALIRMADEVES